MTPHPEMCFLTLVRSKEEARRARLLIESLRAFGGQLHACPVRVFSPDQAGTSNALSGLEHVECLPLSWEEELSGYPLGDKVRACAHGEQMAGPGIRSLVWVNPECLILRPPVLFQLRVELGAAFRPVHIRNIGSPAREPLDDFWQEICQTVGAEDLRGEVESFVDAQRLRPYYNTHCFSVDPARGLCTAWLNHFSALVSDRDFQAGPCRDKLHRIFLHQAVLSALVAERLGSERVRLLPPEYGYPLHLHRQVPPERRAQKLNYLTCAVYEESQDLMEVDANEPLKAWLGNRMKA